MRRRSFAAHGTQLREPEWTKLREIVRHPMHNGGFMTKEETQWWTAPREEGSTGEVAEDDDEICWRCKESRR